MQNDGLAYTLADLSIVSTAMSLWREISQIRWYSISILDVEPPDFRSWSYWLETVVENQELYVHATVRYSRVHALHGIHTTHSKAQD